MYSLTDIPCSVRKYKSLLLVRQGFWDTLYYLCMYLLAIVQDGDANLDGEAGSAVEAVPGGVGRGAGVRLEGDVGPHGWRCWPRFGRAS